jgi:hypothetical protein
MIDKPQAKGFDVFGINLLDNFGDFNRHGNIGVLHHLLLLVEFLCGWLLGQ